MSLLWNWKGKFHYFLNMAAILRDVLVASRAHQMVQDATFVFHLIYKIYMQGALAFLCIKCLSGIFWLTLQDGCPDSARQAVWQNLVILLLHPHTDTSLFRWFGRLVKTLQSKYAPVRVQTLKSRFTQVKVCTVGIFSKIYCYTAGCFI